MKHLKASFKRYEFLFFIFSSVLWNAFILKSKDNLSVHVISCPFKFKKVLDFQKVIEKKCLSTI